MRELWFSKGALLMVLDANNYPLRVGDRVMAAHEGRLWHGTILDIQETWDKPISVNLDSGSIIFMTRKQVISLSTYVHTTSTHVDANPSLSTP